MSTTIQWTLISWFLYLEIAAVALLVLPVLSVQRWRRIFRSRLLSKLDAWSNVYFNVFLFALVLAVWDGLRGAWKHRDEANVVDEKINPQGHTICMMRMFRSQRNLYIAGGALLLWVVLKWMVRSVSQRALMEADLLAAQRQADSATSAAKRLMEAGSGDGKQAAAASQEELQGLRERLAESEAELRRTRASLEAMTAQAESAGREFDKLADENQKLQKRLARLEGSSGEQEELKKDA